MNNITSQDIQNAIATLQENTCGTVYQEVGYTQDGQTLYLVFGYSEGYDKGEKYQVQEGDTLYTLCAKLAFNVSSLQCDYDCDFYMPWSANGDIYDTDSSVDGDFQALADYYNKEAKTIIDLMNSGELAIQ